MEYATIISSYASKGTNYDLNEKKDIEVKYGQIWYIKSQELNGSIQGGKRPVIIVSNDENNLFCPTVNVVPITTREKNDLPVHTFIYSSPFKSTAMAEQITTINKIDLIDCIGSLSKKEIRKLKICMLIQLNLL